MVKKNIVILGAGFAGLRCAQDLAKKKLPAEYDIYLIDQGDRHVFRADLYEVATAYFEGKKSVTDLRWTVATPVRKLINEKKVKFLRDKVDKINRSKREIGLEGGENLKYEYLVVAMGTEVNYYGISGLEECSFPLKEVGDALDLNKKLEELFSGKKKELYLSVGGGGATGVELVGELAVALRKFCKKYRFPVKNVHLRLIEGMNRLSMQNASGTAVIKRRLKKLGVSVHMNSFIQELTADKVILKKKKGTKILKNDLLVWTGGVKINELVAKSLGSKKSRGSVEVNAFLQMEKNKKIFAAGDNAKVLGHNFPMLAWVAYQEGALIANNIEASIQGEVLRSFKPKMYGMLVPVGGKFAIMKWGKVFHAGLLPWLLKRFVYLRYALSIMPFGMALRKWWRSSVIFERND